MAYVETTATRKIVQLTKRIRAVQGGTSASKTVSVLLYLIARAQYDTSPTMTSIVSETFPHLKRGVIRDFQDILASHGYWRENDWNRTDSIFTFPNLSKIEFFSADQPDKVRGPRRDRLFLNEANNLSYETFEQLEVRTREFVILDWNPTNEFWYYTEVEGKRNDCERIVLTYKDNEALSLEIVASIEQRKGRRDWWKVYGEGQLGQLEGKIYGGNGNPWITIDDVPHEARLERYGLDFGYTNDPTAIVAIYYYNGGYILDEMLFRKGMQNKPIADFLMNLPTALVVADSAEPKSIDDIRGYGVHVIGAVKGKDSVRHGISIVQEQKISVTKRSTNIINEYRNYLWKMGRDGKPQQPPEPEHEFSHSMDSIRYGITSITRAKPLSREDLARLNETQREYEITTKGDAGL